MRSSLKELSSVCGVAERTRAPREDELETEREVQCSEIRLLHHVEVKELLNSL